MNKVIGIGFLGLGNIGQGLFRLIEQNGRDVEGRDDVHFLFKRALVRNINKPRSVNITVDQLTTDFEDILNDPEITLVAEFLGGSEPASTYMERLLRAGKSVVTANKEALATNWVRLEEAAKAGQAGLYYEASVCGGIPVIKTIRSSLQSNHISSIHGIINGTTNYILCRMGEGMDYAQALRQAQEKGIAEPDPSVDVNGTDAACKLSILSTLAFHNFVKKEDIFKEGIENIDPRDIALGRKLGYDIKLLAIAKTNGKGIEARVHPAFIPLDHPLCSVRDAYNAVYIKGDAVGNLMLYGHGAGDMPTASAMFSDIISASHAGIYRYDATADGMGSLGVNDDWTCRFYLRILAKDQPGVLAKIAGALGNNAVSIANCLQDEYGKESVPVYVITHPTTEKAMRAAVEEICALDSIENVSALIRVEDEE